MTPLDRLRHELEHDPREGIPGEVLGIPGPGRLADMMRADLGKEDET